MELSVNKTQGFVMLSIDVLPNCLDSTCILASSRSHQANFQMYNPLIATTTEIKYS